MLTKDFKRLEKRIEENYLGRPVPVRFQKEFGKIYNLKDIRPKAISLAKNRGIQVEKFKKMEKGGELNE